MNFKETCEASVEERGKKLCELMKPIRTGLETDGWVWSDKPKSDVPVPAPMDQWFLMKLTIRKRAGDESSVMIFAIAFDYNSFMIKASLGATHIIAWDAYTIQEVREFVCRTLNITIIDAPLPEVTKSKDQH